MYAHHFTKGTASKKKAMDRMSGSGVFARDADTIITLTEHQEEGCYVVEMTLRNFLPQSAFVVEWDFPVMVERPDLNPSDLKLDELSPEADELDPLLAILDGGPLTTGEWQRAAEEEGYSRATFFRMKQRLEAGGRLTFDRIAKTYSRAGNEHTHVSDHPATVAETRETSETFETTETAESKIFPPAAVQAGKGGNACHGQISAAQPAWPSNRFPGEQEQVDTGAAKGPESQSANPGSNTVANPSEPYEI